VSVGVIQEPIIVSPPFNPAFSATHNYVEKMKHNLCLISIWGIYPQYSENI